MLAARDIRPGNIVQIDRSIMMLTEKDIEHMYIFNTWDRIHAINITEQWLICLGFTWQTNNSATKYYVDIFGDAFVKKTPDGRFLTDYRRSSELRYVHELQNLYFSITMEELEVDIDHVIMNPLSFLNHPIKYIDGK